MAPDRRFHCRELSLGVCAHTVIVAMVPRDKRFEVGQIHISTNDRNTKQHGP